jgi:hypothetical protein
MLNFEGMPKLKTLHVDILKANLICISQLFDKDMSVNLTKRSVLLLTKTLCDHLK